MLHAIKWRLYLTSSLYLWICHPPVFKLPRVRTTRFKSSFINYTVDHYVWSRLILKCLIIVSCRCSNERVNVFILYYLHLWVFCNFTFPCVFFAHNNLYNNNNNNNNRCISLAWNLRGQRQCTAETVARCMLGCWYHTVCRPSHTSQCTAEASLLLLTELCPECLRTAKTASTLPTIWRHAGKSVSRYRLITGVGCTLRIAFWFL